jgi:hypothetical protein
MTIDLETKIPYLKTFHEIIYQKGWTFTKSKRVTFISEASKENDILRVETNIDKHRANQDLL